MVPNLMTGTRAMETEYDVRFREWGEAYEDFEADDVRDLIVRAGERLAAVCLDEEAVDTTMKRLHEALGLPELPTDHEGDRSWRTLWKKTSFWRSSRFAARSEAHEPQRLRLLWIVSSP